MKSKILFLFLLIKTVCYGQSNELFFLKGKIICNLKELSSINISNLRSESNTVTDENGNFSIFIKVGDTLQFSSLQVITKKVVIDENEIVKKLYVISLQPKVIPLDEVEVKTYPNINAVSLGILQKPAKQFTPAERKLATATKVYPTLGVGYYIGFSGGLDPLLNWMSGRTTMLKKELTIERKEKLLQKIEYQFDTNYFINDLKIPIENVRGFWYYAIEEPKLTEALNVKNKIMARFIFSDLARKYLELRKTEAK